MIKMTGKMIILNSLIHGDIFFCVLFSQKCAKPNNSVVFKVTVFLQCEINDILKDLIKY